MRDIRPQLKINNPTDLPGVIKELMETNRKLNDFADKLQIDLNNVTKELDRLTALHP